MLTRWFGVVGVVAAAVAFAAPAQAQAPMMMGLGASIPTTPVARTVPIADGFSIRLNVGTDARRNPLLGDNGDMPVHRRLLSAMVDFFPMGGNSGFHISGGTLREFKTKFGAEAEWLNPSKLVAVKVPGNSTFRGNGRRSTPALTVGYSMSPMRNCDLGLEVGEAFGKINTMSPGASASHFADMATNRATSAGGMNAVVHLALGMRF